MKKYALSTTCLTLLLFWPSQAQEIATSTPDARPAILIPARYSTVAETNYLNELALRGMRLETHGLLIESLSGSTVFADLNSDVAFNPASVIKLATSLAALQQFGPDYHFETTIYADGPVDKKRRTLKGNLILTSTGDPNLNSTDITKLLREVVRSGIAHVSGSVIVKGPFAFGSYFTTQKALRGLSTSMRRIGIRAKDGVRASASEEPATGTRIASLVSTSLQEILFFQNAHSNNPIAERLGNTLGGPEAVKQFLVKHVGLLESSVHVSRTSGLDINRITARGAVQLLREMVQYLDAHSLQPHDIMPVAGVDPGTLQKRFHTNEYRGTVVGKTGTLPATDGGVSTLAGIIYTRDRGPVLFAIFNTRGNVTRFRKLQDDLLKSFLTEFGAGSTINASVRKSNN